MSQRPFQLPAVMTSHDGVCQAILTPSRFAISVATSMSNPTYLPVLASYDDCGGYFGSVDTVTVPLLQISASRSPEAEVVAQTVSPPALLVDPPAFDELSDALPHAASGRASRLASANRTRFLCMGDLLVRARFGAGKDGTNRC